MSISSSECEFFLILPALCFRGLFRNPRDMYIRSMYLRTTEMICEYARKTPCGVTSRTEADSYLFGTCIAQQYTRNKAEGTRRTSRTRRVSAHPAVSRMGNVSPGYLLCPAGLWCAFCCALPQPLRSLVQRYYHCVSEVSEVQRVENGSAVVRRSAARLRARLGATARRPAGSLTLADWCWVGLGAGRSTVAGGVGCNRQSRTWVLGTRTRDCSNWRFGRCSGS